MKADRIEGETPSIEGYVAFRREAGLGAPSIEAARIGLGHDTHVVAAWQDGALVRPTRLVGDQGSDAQGADLAVRADRRQHGIGRELVGRMVIWPDTSLPSGCTLGLIDDDGSELLYPAVGSERRTDVVRAFP